MFRANPPLRRVDTAYPQQAGPTQVYLDVSRLIWRSWTGRTLTGIDRVCFAYLKQYRASACAVVQHRGVRRILTPRHSQALFDLLLGPDGKFRTGLLALAPFALAAGRGVAPCHGGIYLNLGHTDIDMPCLAKWVEECDLQPIYMVHDLIPVMYPQYCTERAITRHRGRIDNALAHAAGLIANSESSAEEIRKYAYANGYRLPPIQASLLAGAQLVSAGPGPNRPKSYFTYVSTMEARKNHQMLLEIWTRLTHDMGSGAPHLVLIGQKGASSGKLSAMIAAEPALRRYVTILSDCTDDEVAHWVAGARAMLFPSFAEGFGIPLVEALQLGTPVIASDLPCFREIGQNVPTLLDPADAEAWEETIRDYAFDSLERDRQIERIKSFCPPTWESHFETIDSWLGSIQLRNSSRAARSVSGPLLPAHADRIAAPDYAKSLAGRSSASIS